MTAPVLVIGASGNVGVEIVKYLCAHGCPVRAAGTDAGALRRRFGEDVATVPFDFARPETFPAAVHGVERMFLMRPPQITNVQKYMFPVVDAAKEAGVRQVVFLSLIGIEQNRRVPHYAVEQYLIASQIPYTFLRASFFMQNLNTMHQAEIRDRNEIFVPVGRGKTSFIDVRDIAAVAALALTEAGHENKAYELTGGEALDYYEVAEQFSQVLQRPILYRNPSPWRFFWRSVRSRIPLTFALVMTWLYVSTRNGMAAQVTDELARILGRRPLTLRQYIMDYQAYWR